jgi:hypothetical protein
MPFDVDLKAPISKLVSKLIDRFATLFLPD